MTHTPNLRVHTWLLSRTAKFACLSSPCGAAATSLLHRVQCLSPPRWHMTTHGTSLENCSKLGRWKAAPSNYAGFPVSSLTVYRMYLTWVKAPPANTYEWKHHILLLHTGNCPTRTQLSAPLQERLRGLSHSSYLAAEGSCFPTWHSQKMLRQYFAWETGVKVVSFI